MKYFSIRMTTMIKLLHNQLKIALNGELPGEISHKKMLPPERNLSYSKEEQKLVKKSSILVLIYPDGDELFTCLMKRPDTMKYHPGQICFPGGRIEEDDEDEIHTALREANEEIGLNPNEIEVVGQLSNLHISVSRFEISPIVAVSLKKPVIIGNPSEVEKLFFLPIIKQLHLEKYPTTALKTNNGQINVPCLFFENEIIWGATAMILSELFDVLKTLPINQE